MVSVDRPLHLLLPADEVAGEVIFSVVSVCVFMGFPHVTTADLFKFVDLGPTYPHREPPRPKQALFKLIDL